MYAGIVEADLYSSIRIAKDDGMSFQAIAANRNEQVHVMMMRQHVQYMTVARKRVEIARRELSGVQRGALVQVLAKFYPGMAPAEALTKALEPAPFRPYQVWQ